MVLPASESDEETLDMRHQRLRLEQRLFGDAERVQVGRYTLDEWLGSGGTGAVYAARDRSLDRRIAIKVLHRRLSDSPDANARLVREAKAMARISNAHVVIVHEVGIERGQPYIAMELMLGGSLADWARRHPFDEAGRTDRLLVVLRACAQGLLAAHDAGFVHRDFKPENVLLTQDGVAKVADFGQHAGIADERSDQYALCTTFLELLGPSARPSAVDAILRRGSATDPAQRFASIRDLLRALDKASARRHRGAMLASIAVASALVVGAVAWSAQGDPQDATTPCESGAEQLDAAWSEQRQAEIRTAFENSGSPSWRPVWDGVHTGLDVYTGQWAAARLDACEATRIRRVQDEAMMTMRLACLDQRRAALEMLADAYAAADRAVVDDALTTASALPSIATCADREELVYGGDGLTLENPQVRAAYDALGRADSLRRLGRWPEAQAAYAALAPELEALGVNVLLAKCLRAQAHLLFNTGGDLAEANRLARAALDQAELAENLSEQVFVWALMSQIAGNRSLYDDSELYLERAEALVARRPDAKSLQATVVGARGSYEGLHGDLEASVAAHDRAAALAAEVGSSPMAILSMRFNSLNLLSRLGRDDEALRRSTDILREARERFGPRHPMTLAVTVARAQLFRHRGEWSEVEDLTRDGLELSMHEYRPDVVVALRSSYAAAQAGMQRFDEAQRVLEQVIEEALPILGRKHLQVVVARTGLAKVHIDAKHFREASAELDPMLDLVGTQMDAGSSPVHPRHRCRYWSFVALVRSAEQRHPEAAEAADLALAICRKAAAARSTWMFTALRYAGEVYEQARQSARALASYEEARAIADEITVAPDELAFVDAGLARLRP